MAETTRPRRLHGQLQRLGGGVRRPGVRRRAGGADRPPRLRPQAAGDRGHRDRHAGRGGRGAPQHGPAARPGPEDRPRRLRRRLFQPQPPAALPVRQAEDRPRVRHRLRRGRAVGHPGPRRGLDRPGAGHEGGGRGRRDRGAAQVPEGGRRPRHAGLPVRQARADRGPEGAAGGHEATTGADRRTPPRARHETHADPILLQGCHLHRGVANQPIVGFARVRRNADPAASETGGGAQDGERGMAGRRRSA